MQQGKVFKSDGTVQNVTPADGVRFSLSELQTAVGGDIELIQLSRGHGHGRLFANEDGRRLNLPANLPASKLAQRMLVGDVILVTGSAREKRKPEYQPKTGERCGCKRGIERDNCPQCEGTGMKIDFAAIRARR